MEGELMSKKEENRLKKKEEQKELLSLYAVEWDVG